jgi:hypothetical protein
MHPGRRWQEGTVPGRRPWAEATAAVHIRVMRREEAAGKGQRKRSALDLAGHRRTDGREEVDGRMHAREHIVCDKWGFWDAQLFTQACDDFPPCVTV